MTQEELNKQLSDIPDEVLITKSEAILQDWCNGGKKFVMNVPPTKDCPDLIIAELIERYKKLSLALTDEFKDKIIGMSTEDMESHIKEINGLLSDNKTFTVIEYSTGDWGDNGKVVGSIEAESKEDARNKWKALKGISDYDLAFCAFNEK